MSRRAVLLAVVFTVTSQLSTGCCCWRPFLWRWGCGGCWPQFYTPPPAAPAFHGPVVGDVGPADCACFSPPASAPIAVSQAPIAVSPAHAAPVPGPYLNGPPPGYVAPPPAFSGQPSSVLPPPQVMKEGPMPMIPPASGGK
jgi:hypothetical protein